LGAAEKVVKRRSFLLLAASAACRHTPPSAGVFAQAALEIAQRERAHADAAWARDELTRIAERVRAVGPVWQSALTSVLFDELRFTREVTSTELGFLLLPSVLRHRRGSCVGLGTVYLAVAEALGFAASGVLMPGHFYVRAGPPEVPRNVELLRRGEAMPDSWYRNRYPIPDSVRRSSYARPLSHDEVLGVIEYDVGTELRRKQHVTRAKTAYTRAVMLLPDFAPAHASLGAVQHLLGDYAAAHASYGSARQLDPDLPGLRENMALLESESHIALGR
jgi:regulator of sirC expression with transglutaminase-like and TPR domain